METMFILQGILLVILLIIIIILFRNVLGDKKAARIKYYSLEPIKREELSFSDKFVSGYISFVGRFRKIVKKSNYFTKRSKKYERYIKYKDRDRVQTVDFITNKFIISIVFIILTTISQIFTTNYFSLFGYIINYFIGYYLLDILLFLNYKRKTRNIENDLLRAIIIMNNCFKAGKSTLQALQTASAELPYPLGDEFKKMYLDMKYGLSVDTVFERFARRVKQEAVYVSSSLTVLNKTGGNIVEVFSSIERTLFDKKKLKEEMKNISSAPKIVVIILSIVPVLFIGVVYLLNPTYFNPLFSSTLGYIIIAIIVIMFIIYLITLLRTLKVDE